VAYEHVLLMFSLIMDKYEQNIPLASAIYFQIICTNLQDKYCSAIYVGIEVLGRFECFPPPPSFSPY
jgi:hypothetical protein